MYAVFFYSTAKLMPVHNGLKSIIIDFKGAFEPAISMWV
jgi:hypothetical protein